MSRKHARHAKNRTARSTRDAPVSVRPPISWKKRFVFTLVAVCLGMGIVALAEVAARATGYGDYPPTIVEVADRADGSTVCITDTPGPASYFFANRSKPGSINSFTFLHPKPKGTVRVFLGGGSAMKGFPQPMAFAPSAFLEAMLEDAWPDRDVEVINLGTTAVASFPVLGMLAEAMDYEPDLVVVLSGHNEFYGAYGIASLHSAGNRPWALAVNRWLRGTAIMQLADRWVYGGPAGAPDKTLMEVMIGQDHLGPDDPRRAAAARNLGAHVSAMIDMCAQRKVPFIVCTLPSNERDLAPLGSARYDHLSEADRKKTEAALLQGEAWLERDSQRATAELQTVVAMQPGHARAWYLLGRAAFAQGQYDAARERFQRAIDFDPMPWRAPGPSNDAVIASAGAHPGAVLCDLRASFRAASPGGCIGWELMDDHVHPSLVGQAQVARAIVESMQRLRGPLAVSSEQVAALPSNEAYTERLGDNVYDRYGVAHTLRVLCDIPFIRKTNPHAFERFDAVTKQLESNMPPEVLAVARKWQSPEMHPGAKRPIAGMVGRALIRMGRLAEAIPLYEVAERCVALYSSWNLEYVYFQIVCRQRVHGALSDSDRRKAAAAIKRGRFLLAHGHSPTGMAERYVGRLHQLLGAWEEAILFLLASRAKVSGTDLVAVDQALAMSYMRLGRRDEAVTLIQNGIDHSGQYAGLYRRMMQSLDAMAEDADTMVDAPAMD